MNLKVEVITNANSNKNITQSLLQLLSKYEKNLAKNLQDKKNN